MTRRAIVTCSAELLADGLGPLTAAGLRIVRTFDSSRLDEGVALLGIEGDALPAECETASGEVREVAITFQTDTAGAPRTTRVAEIKVTGRFLDDLAYRRRGRKAPQ